MAITDAHLHLTKSGAMDLGTIADAATGLSADWIDLQNGILTEREDIGGAEPVRMMIHCVEAPEVASGAPTFVIALVASNVVDPVTTPTTAWWVATWGLWGSANHGAGLYPTLGSFYEVPIPSIQASLGTAGQTSPFIAAAFGRRYLRAVYYNMAGSGQFHAGAFQIYLTKDVPSGGKLYPAALGNAT